MLYSESATSVGCGAAIIVERSVQRMRQFYMQWLNAQLWVVIRQC